MAFRYLAGPSLNHLTRMGSDATMTPGALLGFPATNAYDNRTSRPAVFGIAAEDSVFAVDLNLVAGSEFETSTDADSWTMLGLGSVSLSTADYYTGAASGLVNVSSCAAEAIAYQDVDVRPGEELNFFGAAKGTEAYIRVRNRDTGKWLGSTGNWSSTQIDLVTSAGTWTVGQVSQFTVESLAECLNDIVTLRVYLHTASSTLAYFDQIELHPSVNWFSIHGHNVPPFISPEIESSTDGASWTPYDTMTLKRDTFALASTALETERYWRLVFAGEPDGLLYFGEIVLGQYQELLQNPAYGGTLRWTEQQTRLETDMGEAVVHLHNRQPQRTLLLSFTHHGTEQYEQFHKQLYRGSRGGANLICVAPTDMDADVVVLGRIRDTIDIVKNTTHERTTALEILEMPLPNSDEIVSAHDEPQPRTATVETAELLLASAAGITRARTITVHTAELLLASAAGITRARTITVHTANLITAGTGTYSTA